MQDRHEDQAAAPLGAPPKTTPSEILLSLPAGSPASLGQVTEVAGRLARAMNSVIEGKPDVVHTAITVLLAEGHLLLEDVPGVGKTMLAKTLARSIDGRVFVAGEATDSGSSGTVEGALVSGRRAAAQVLEALAER